ncbi:WD40 repeat-containing [Brachionus plicatilis]|uniref:WD40 repeat-containing n=1 Tax=Brachionus plicatilis TaxID=10195 RepID=A0A3M7ST14_BRAPC|nr:WD40 repeat-containing [Brachionus plicatilis]
MQKKIRINSNFSLKMSLHGQSSEVLSLAVLNNGLLASGSKDNGCEIMTLNGHSDWVFSLAVLKNGDLASGSADRKIKIWNTNNGSEKMTLNGHLHDVRSLAVLNNGDLAKTFLTSLMILKEK